MKKSILIITSLCISSHAMAGGYRVSTQGQQALGMGHTGVAVTESSETVFVLANGCEASREKNTAQIGGE